MTGEQWLGVGILAVLVGATLFLVHRFQPSEPEVVEVVSDSVLTQFATYQAEQDSIRKATWKKQYPRDTIAIRMQVFDPNTADSSTLVHLGLKKWQVSNMLKYRAKGGRYRRAEDMKKLYGIDMELTQFSKTIDKIPQPDIAISMGCDVGCPYIGRAFDDDWGLPDPTGKNDADFIEVIKEIESHTKNIR